MDNQVSKDLEKEIQKDIQQAIVKTAMEFEGQEEIRGNMGFKDDEFEALMISVGWQKTFAWCSYFAELVWKHAYSSVDSRYIDILDAIFSGSAVQTFHSFKKSKYFETSSKAVPGALAVWQKYRNGQPHWTGHIGVVVELEEAKNRFWAMEGNTNDDGSREGYEVAKRRRGYDFKTTNGLRLLGFVIPNAESLQK